MIDNLGYVRPNEVMQGHCSDFCLEASEFNRVYWSINLRSAYYRPPTLFMGKTPSCPQMHPSVCGQRLCWMSLVSFRDQQHYTNAPIDLFKCSHSTEIELCWSPPFFSLKNILWNKMQCMLLSPEISAMTICINVQTGRSIQIFFFWYFWLECERFSAVWSANNTWNLIYFQIGFNNCMWFQIWLKSEFGAWKTELVKSDLLYF